MWHAFVSAQIILSHGDFGFGVFFPHGGHAKYFSLVFVMAVLLPQPLNSVIRESNLKCCYPIVYCLLQWGQWTHCKETRDFKITAFFVMLFTRKSCSCQRTRLFLSSLCSQGRTKSSWWKELSGKVGPNSKEDFVAGKQGPEWNRAAISQSHTRVSVGVTGLQVRKDKTLSVVVLIKNGF